jgi:hypothetical protein
MTDCVLLVCKELYLEKVRQEVANDEGPGVSWGRAHLAMSVAGPNATARRLLRVLQGRAMPKFSEDSQRLLGYAYLDVYHTAGLLTPVAYHTWRATGITIYLENDGRLEHAQQMAGHEPPRPSSTIGQKDEITLSEVERIRL